MSEISELPADWAETAVSDNGDWSRLTIPYSQIPAIPATYLWPGVIPNRTPVLIVAPGGTGKGLAIAAITALVTTGEPFPGETEEREPGQVIQIAPEDDANEDQSFRLQASGASLSLVHDLTYLPDGAPFTLPGNILELRRAITEINDRGGPPVRLVTLDPLLALCENGLSSQRAVREVICPLQDVAREYGGAMILSHHTTKDGKTVAGSKALTDTCRMAWLVQQAGDDDSARVMTPWKSNRATAGAVRFRILGDGNDTHAVFATSEDAASVPGSRAARLRLRLTGAPSLSEMAAKAQKWLDEHPEPGTEVPEPVPESKEEEAAA